MFLSKCTKLLKYPSNFLIKNFKRNTSTSEETIRKAFKHKNRKALGSFGWFLLAVPGTTFALGTWQIQRKQWKESLIKELKDRVNMTPVKLPETLEEIQSLEYYPVHVQGHYQHDKELHLGPRTLLDKGDAATTSSLMTGKQSQSTGYLVITPFKLADREETILVNRGWVPLNFKDPNKRKSGQIDGLTDVIGVVRLQEARPNFMPANKDNAWFYRDLEKMSSATGASPIFIDATTDVKVPNGPIPGQTRISLRNEHLSYVLTWYTLSFLTSFMWYKQFIKPV